MAFSGADEIFKAAESLRMGGTVIFPTETVYGLGANALSGVAVAKIFELKKRPHFNPLIVHAPSLEKALLLGDFPPKAIRLAQAFWPGPLTLVVPRRAPIADLVTAGLNSVGIRVPSHPVASALLEAAGVPIAAPSANLFQSLSVTRVEDLSPELSQRVDAVLDGGPCPVGLESTIIGFVDNEPRLFRPGGTPLEDIEARIGQKVPPLKLSDQRPLAPGMLARHYSPRTPVVFGETLGIDTSHGKRIGLISLTPPSPGHPFAAVEALSARGDLREAASGLFAALRRLDSLGLDVILAKPFPNSGLGLALNDRLARASECAEKHT